MNRNFLLLMAVFVATTTNLSAQRGGAAAPGRGGALRGMSNHRPNRSNSDRSRRNRSDSRNYDGYSNSGWLYPDSYFDNWDFPIDIHDADSASQPGAALIVPAIEPESPPPPPVTPAVYEYSWPDSSSGSATAFAIVSKAGKVHRAIALWVQDGSLCFTTPDGVGKQLPLNDVDGRATTRLNAEMQLKLSIPLPASDEDEPVRAR